MSYTRLADDSPKLSLSMQRRLLSDVKWLQPAAHVVLRERSRAVPAVVWNKAMPTSRRGDRDDQFMTVSKSNNKSWISEQCSWHAPKSSFDCLYFIHVIMSLLLTLTGCCFYFKRKVQNRDRGQTIH